MNKYNTKEPGNCELLMTRKIRHHMNWQEITDKMKKGILRTDIGTIVSCNLTNGTSAKFVVTDVTDQTQVLPSARPVFPMPFQPNY